MKKVVELYPYSSALRMLRDLADQMEKGEVKDESCTVIVGMNIYNFGVTDDAQAAKNAIFDMTVGIAQLTKGALEALEE